MKTNINGYCPYCGHNCEDKYIGISARLINDKYYDTVKCSKCGKKFDRLYDMKFIQSQETKPTKELI